MSLLKAENINSGYDKKQILFNVSFEIKEGDFVLLIGSNGSGKSTLLKTIYGLVEKDTFCVDKDKVTNIIFNGFNISKANPSQLISLGISFVPQKDNYFENLTVQENLEVSGLNLKNKQIYKERTRLLFAQFPELESNLGKLATKLSGGEKQILAIAMALLHKPKLLMFDEPLAGLSSYSVRRILAVLTDLNEKQGITLLIVEHKIKELFPFSKTLIALKYGKIVKNVKININNKVLEKEIIALRDVFI